MFELKVTVFLETPEQKCSPQLQRSRKKGIWVYFAAPLLCRLLRRQLLLAPPSTLPISAQVSGQASGQPGPRGQRVRVGRLGIDIAVPGARVPAQGSPKYSPAATDTLRHSNVGGPSGGASESRGPHGSLQPFGTSPPFSPGASPAPLKTFLRAWLR